MRIRRGQSFREAQEVLNARNRSRRIARLKAARAKRKIKVKMQPPPKSGSEPGVVYMYTID